MCRQTIGPGAPNPGYPDCSGGVSTPSPPNPCSPAGDVADRCLVFADNAAGNYTIGGWECQY
jgi:hypothetical protein